MYGAEFFDFSLWWVFPLVMIVLCFFMMRGRRGSTMCGFNSKAPAVPGCRESEAGMKAGCCSPESTVEKK
jgi:hypothetical protein